VTTVNPLPSADPLATLLGITVPSSRFPPNSRYATVPTTTLQGIDGRVVTYLRRRFVPSPEHLTVIERHQVAQGERLDTIAAEILGDPELFWRLCDGNRAMRPRDLTDVIGRLLAVTLPESPPGVTGA
jgi:hypothetical protein